MGNWQDGLPIQYIIHAHSDYIADTKMVGTQSRIQYGTPINERMLQQGGLNHTLGNILQNEHVGTIGLLPILDPGRKELLLIRELREHPEQIVRYIKSVSRKIPWT